LVLGSQWQHLAGRDIYPAGDALGFIDPFTGLGLVTAVGTGRLAGLAASRQSLVEQHLSNCRRAVRGPFCLAAAFRAILGAGLAQSLGPLIPAGWLFQMTRPRRSCFLKIDTSVSRSPVNEPFARSRDHRQS